jgi:CRISPR/Cas system-associated endonuclease Cas1
MVDIYKYNNKMSVLTKQERKFDLTFAIVIPKSITMDYDTFMDNYMEGEDEEVKIKIWKALVKEAMENKYEEIDLGEAESEEWDDRMDDMTPIENHIEKVKEEEEEGWEGERYEERIIVSKK